MKTAYMFPGQGSQFVGMGRDIYEADSSVRSLFEQANNLLGYNLRKIMFRGPAERLCQTEIAQPAIFLHSYCLATLLPRPDLAAGHSVGMYAALATAGVFDFESALKLVSARAKAMQYAGEVNPGTMAAIIGLSDDAVEQICARVSRQDHLVQVANYNCPGQLVISGTRKAVVKAMEQAREAGARLVKELEVSGAFHSLLMVPAYDQLALAIDQMPIGRSKFSVYSDIEATPLADYLNIRLTLLRQLIQPVRWAETVRRMIADADAGKVRIMEVGPGKVLRGLIRRIDKDAAVCGADDLSSSIL